MTVSGGCRACKRSLRFFYLPASYPPAMSDRRNRSPPRRVLDSEGTEAARGERGQIDPRYIVGAIVLVFLAKPLAAAAFDIQSSLASTPVFSWFWSSVIALLFVAAIVAAVLGLE